MEYGAMFTLFQETPQHIFQAISTLKQILSKLGQQELTFNIFQGYKRSKISQKISEFNEVFSLYKQIMPYIATWKVDSFSTRLLQPSKNIVQLMSGIKFENLKLIDLSGNNIESLEPLQWLDTKKLSYLALSNNKICSIKSFSKCRFKTLNNLDIGQNLLNHSQLKYLTKFFQKLEIHDLKLSHESYVGKSKQNNFEYSCIEEIFKFSTNNINKITIESTFLTVNENMYKRLNCDKLKSWNYIFVYRIK